MVNIQDLFDDAKCYQSIRAMRWPDGVTCQRRSSGSVIRNGRDETQPDRQRYECKGCHQRFDDLTDTIFAGHHQPLRTYARDDDGDGFCEVHVNTLKGFWSLLRSWLRPHRGIPQESLPLYLGFFAFVHNVRARGRRLLGSLIGLLLAPPRNQS
jgi:hypothetical protein